MDLLSTTTEPLIPATIPNWLVIVLAGLALVVIFWILARIMRLFAAVLAVAAIGVASWLAWQYLFG